MNRTVNTVAPLLAALVAGGAQGQAFPSKPIKVVIPLHERMTQIGFDVVAGTPEEFGRFMKDEVDRWTAVVNKGGIKPD